MLARPTQRHRPGRTAKSLYANSATHSAAPPPRTDRAAAGCRRPRRRAAERALGEAALRARRGRGAGRRRAGRAAGSASTSPRACSRSARSPARRCSRSTPRKSSPSAAATASRPVPGHDQPGHPRRDARLLRGERATSACRADEVFFFQQGTMPALDLATGKLLLEAPGRLFLSPNGHGGTLTALADMRPARPSCGRAASGTSSTSRSITRW